MYLNHFLNSSYDYDKPIIIVKQKYLNQSNKTIFKNIKHFYYYAQADYSFDEYDQIHYKKFWNENEKFRFPKSVKFNNLETLNVYGGRDFELSRLSLQIDCTNLKQLVLHDCVGSDRSLPYLPNLKTLIIHDKYQAKAKDYNKFSNIKNVYYSNTIKHSLEDSDLVIIHTEWNDFKSINFKNLVKNKKVIIYDMRNIYTSTKIKKQGFKYYSIGR